MKRLVCMLLTCIIMLSTFTIAYADDNTELTRIKAVHMLSKVLPCCGQGIPFDDTNDALVSYYHAMKVVSGDGNNNFLPNGIIRTADFLLILKRALDIACPDLYYDSSNIKWYSDQLSIYKYANCPISFLTAIGVYNSTGYLNPTSYITEGMAKQYIEQAVYAMNYGQRSHNGENYKTKPIVLMYHKIGAPDIGNLGYLSVSEYNFEQQIKYLYENGYTFLFPEEISLASNYKKSVIITFDDGYIDNYTKAYPILRKYCAKATLFAVGDYIGLDGYCNPDHLRDMSDSGIFRIYAHTKSHSALTDLTYEQMCSEFSAVNNQIYNITKREVTCMSYPFGMINDTVTYAASRYYKSAYSVYFTKSTSMYNICRQSVDDSLNISQFQKILSNKS